MDEKTAREEDSSGASVYAAARRQLQKEFGSCGRAAIEVFKFDMSVAQKARPIGHGYWIAVVTGDQNLEFTPFPQKEDADDHYTFALPTGRIIPARWADGIITVPAGLTGIAEIWIARYDVPVPNQICGCGGNTGAGCCPRELNVNATGVVNFAPAPGSELIEIVDASGGPIQRQLPAAVAGNKGQVYVAKKTDATVNVIRIVAAFIDGIAGGVSLTAQNQAARFVSDGATWWVI